MNFEPTPEQLRLLDLASAFATEGGALPATDAESFPAKASAGLGGCGLFSTRPALDAALVTMTLARASAALGAAFASGWLFLDALRRYGDTTLGSVAASVEAGVRIAAVVLPSRKENTEGGIVASGAAGALTLAGISAPAAFVPVASDALVVARLENGDDLLACVELSAKGVSKGRPLPSLGLEGAPRGALELRGVQVATEQVLARGYEAGLTLGALYGTRSILSAAVAVGVAGRALDRTLSHVRARGKVAQSTEFVVSDLSTAYDAARLATAQAAFRRDAGDDAGEGGATAKLLATRAATQICHGALGVCGEAGYDDALRRAYLDARHLELYDGAEAEQIDDIASRMLGES
ncbi:MAG TPA: acyl-CoA dehydrogenase family protein [Polyangiaceae bacterium]|nr:acyl-CoA dehydrogenase family protein [Polyangiaceae bacterium]